MWEKKRGFTPHTGVLLPIMPVSQWTIPEINQTERLLETPNKTSFSARNSTKLCYTLLKFFKA